LLLLTPEEGLFELTKLSITGPNAATSHTSAIMASENTINLALRQIKPVLDGRATSIEVTQSAEEEQVYQLQKDLSTRVWASGCNGWYVSTNDGGQPAWNATLWPYSQANLWYRSLFPVKSHWKYTVRQPVNICKVNDGTLTITAGHGIFTRLVSIAAVRCRCRRSNLNSCRSWRNPAAIRASAKLASELHSPIQLLVMLQAVPEFAM
jgi:hypothetical protein